LGAKESGRESGREGGRAGGREVGRSPSNLAKRSCQEDQRPRAGSLCDSFHHQSLRRDGRTSKGVRTVEARGKQEGRCAEPTGSKGVDGEKESRR
jgi:hypothetical protein